MIKLEFFQNFVTENRNGGKYDFDRLKKMPYLIRLRYQKAVNSIRSMLLKEGFADDSKVTHKSALANVMQRRKELEDFQGKGFYARERQSYNITDGDGVALKDGDVRYFYDLNNRLSKATVYHNINNMWWAVFNESRYTNIASFRLFSWKPGLPRRKYPKPESRIQSLLDTATKHMDFERAIVYRDLLKARNPSSLEVSISG
ncbi:MAG: hypothetical protein P4L67_04445 [Candidatus Pacebacteria bacterium]|nr:hypothetical protein [Candidatus Paceibacterota bacterium]